MLAKKYVKRWQKLIENSKTIPSRHFDFNLFASSEEEKNTNDWMMKIAKDLCRIGREATAGNCGSTGCMIGFFPVWWPRNFQWIHSFGFAGIQAKKNAKLVVSVPQENIFSARAVIMEESYSAAADWLGVTTEEIEDLFSPDGEAYVAYYNATTPVPKRVVIQNMKRFLVEKMKA